MVLWKTYNMGHNDMLFARSQVLLWKSLYHTQSNIYINMHELWIWLSCTVIVQINIADYMADYTAD